MRTGSSCQTPADETGVGSSSCWHATAFAADSACIAGGFRTDALVDVVAHMRSAKVGLVTRTVANAAAALRTVPAGRISVRFFARTIIVRAYPTALACKIWMRRCAALRRPTCFELVCTCKFHECGGIRPVRVAAQRLQLSVYGRRSNRYAHYISTRTCSADQNCTPRRPRL